MQKNNVICKNDLCGKRVIVRVDFNVPIENNKVKDNSRIKVVNKTIKYLQEAGAKIILLSHFGNPNGRELENSMRVIIDELHKLYNTNIIFIENFLKPDTAQIINNANINDIILLENIRFYEEEKICDVEFAEKIAKLGDFYINEAFSVAHRNHASVVALPKFLPHAYGFAFLEEMLMIDDFIMKSAAPRMCIIGGSKLSTKVKLLKSLVTKVDKLALGGGIAGAFLSYFGNNMLKIFDEEVYHKDVEDIVTIAKQRNCTLIMPVDFSALISNGESMDNSIITDSSGSASVFDIGPQSAELYCKHIRESASVLWNGPVGLFEKMPFDHGTRVIAEEIACCTKHHGMQSIIGGGDTVYALNKFEVINDISYVSTSGGAFLAYLEGDGLPGIDAMAEACKLQ